MANKNYIFFNPREWRLIQGEHENARYERFFADHPVKGGLAEMVELSNFGGWYTRLGRLLCLERNTTYHFVFWLNGGENDAATEVCNLLVLYLDKSDGEISQDEWENRCIYKLNRSYIRPVKHCSGWELYDIVFQTDDKVNVLLCFEVDKAPLAVVHADAVEAYGDLEDEVDEFAARRPQRHNIVFSDGWPTNTWYATEVLRRSSRHAGNDSSLSSLSEDLVDQIRDNHLEEICEVLTVDICENLADQIRDDHLEEICEEVMGEVCDILVDQIRDNHLEEICEEVMGEIRDNLVEQVRDNHLEEICEEVMGEVRESLVEQIRDNHLEEICEEVMGEVRESLVEQIRDNHLEEMSKEIHENLAEQIRDNHLEEICENVMGEICENLAEQIRDNHLEEICKDVMDDVRENLVEEIRRTLG